MLFDKLKEGYTRLARCKDSNHWKQASNLVWTVDLLMSPNFQDRNTGNMNSKGHLTESLKMEMDISKRILKQEKILQQLKYNIPLC